VTDVSRLPVVEHGIFVLGMHRSGTSAVTRFVSLLGAATPVGDDLVQPTDKNPKGYWESESLVNFNERVLKAVGCDMRCPIELPPGWERDPRLDALRVDGPTAVRVAFATEPWVWKDPRHCLTFSFWRDVLDVRPAIVLVNRNPLEIAASVGRVRTELDKMYALALWERYLRQGLRQVRGLPVYVTSYEDLLADPLGWLERIGHFLANVGVPVEAPDTEAAQSFLDAQLRHARYSVMDVLEDDDVSDAQRALYRVLCDLEGAHENLLVSALPWETPTTEAVLDKRRASLERSHELARKLQLERESRWWRRAGRSRWARPVRPLHTLARGLLRPPPWRRSRSASAQKGP